MFSWLDWIRLGQNLADGMSFAIGVIVVGVVLILIWKAIP